MKKHVTLAGVCAFGIAGAAFADVDGVTAGDLLNIQIFWGDQLAFDSDLEPGGFTDLVLNEDGSYTIEGAWDAGDWSTGWTFEVGQFSDSAARGGFDSGFVISNFNFTNNTGDDNAEFVLIADAVVGPLSAPTTMTGSVTGSLNSGDPGNETAMLTVPAGDFLYSAMADGATARTLLDDSFSKSTTLSESLGSHSFVGENGPSVVNELSIRHSFGLTDGDNVNLQGAFVVTEIPAPGAAALFGLAGAFGVRRRR